MRQTTILALSVLALMLFAPWVFGQDAASLTELRRRAEQGDSSAQYNLGVIYLNGKGVPQDYSEAVSWFRKAAEQGVAGAQYNLGLMYANGHGVPQDYQEAVSWFRKAAEQGKASAQHNLGVMYHNGQGVPQGLPGGGELVRKAAEQGYASAQYNLGLMYANGQGVPQDYVQAHKWFILAASLTTERAKDYRLARDELAKKMTASQVGQAHLLAVEWQPKTWEQLKDK